MYKRISYCVYVLLVILFVLLVIFFVLVGVYLERDESSVWIFKVQLVVE